MEALQNTVACIEACRLDELFADSKFLRAESLLELVKAIMWACGPIQRIAANGENCEAAEARPITCAIEKSAAHMKPCSV